MENGCSGYRKRFLSQLISAIFFTLLFEFFISTSGHAMYARTGANQERVVILFEAFNRGSLVVPPMPDNLPVGAGWLSKDKNTGNGFDYWRLVDSPSYGPAEGAAHSSSADNLESYLSIRNMNFKGLTDSHLSFKLYSNTDPGSNPLENDDYLQVRIRYWDDEAKQTQQMCLFDSREALAAGTLLEETWTEMAINLPVSVNGSDAVDLEFVYITGPGGLLDFNGPGVAIDNVSITAMDGYNLNSPACDSIIRYKDDLGQDHEVSASIKYNPVKPGEMNEIPFLEYDLSAIDSLRLTLTGPNPADEQKIAVDLFEVLSRGRHVDHYSPRDWIDKNNIVNLNIGSGVTIKFPVKQGIFNIFNNISMVENSIAMGKLLLDSSRKNHYSELLLGMLMQSDLSKAPYITEHIYAGHYGVPDLPTLLGQHSEALNELSIGPPLSAEDQFHMLLQASSDNSSMNYNAMGDLGTLLSLLNNIDPDDITNLIGEGAENIPAVSWLANLATGLNIGRSVMSSYFTASSNSRRIKNEEAQQIAMNLIYQLFYDLVELSNRIDTFEKILHNQPNLDPMLLEAWKTARIQAITCKLEEAKFTFDDIANLAFTWSSHINNAASIIGALGQTGWGHHLAGHIGLSHGALAKNVGMTVKGAGAASTALVIYTAATYYNFFAHIASEADILANSALSYNIRQLLLQSHTDLIRQLSHVNSTARTLKNYRAVHSLYGMHGYLCWRDIAALQSDEYDSFLLDLVSSWTTADTYISMLDAYRTRFADDMLDTMPLPAIINRLKDKIQICYDRDKDGIEDSQDICPTIYNPDQSDVCNYSGSINVNRTSAGSYVRVNLQGIAGGSNITIASADNTYSTTFTVPASGRIFKEVRAGSTDDLLVDITDPYGTVYPQKRIGLIVDTSDRVTNLRAMPANNSVTINYSHASGYNNIVAVRYAADPGNDSYAPEDLPAPGDPAENGEVVYIGSATSFTNSNLDTGQIYYYRISPYRPRYVTVDEQQFLEGYDWGKGVTTSVRTYLSGTISKDMALIKEDTHPYLLNGNVTIAAATTLTINPGVTVYGYNQGSRLIVNGTLNAAATRENDRIVFTSDNGTPAAGDWGYIYFAQGSTGNLDFVTVEYGGDNNSRSQNTTGLSCAGIYINSSPTIDHLTLSHISNVSQYNNGTYSNQTAAGIWIDADAAPVISNSLIEDIESHGIYASSDTTGAYHISNCDIQDSGSGLYIAGTGEYQVEKNTLSGNKLAGYWFPSSAANVTDNLFVDNDDNDALRIQGTIKSNTTWNDDIKLYGTVTIAAGATLTINPGVKVYGYDRGSRLIVNGTLNAAATDENDRILFTSDNKTPGAGDWGYIYFAQGSTGNLDFVTVEYGGDNNNTSSNTTGLSCAGIYINSSPTINHLTLSHISNVSQYNNGTYSNQTAAGIWIDADAAPVISNSLIEDIESHGIYASSDTTGAYHISNCDIQDSGSGLYIAGTGKYQVEKNTLSGNKLAGYWFPSSAANVTDNLFVDNDDNDALRIRGTIKSNTTWNDDIKLYGTVTIAAGATLTINPGVKVYGYDRGSRLIVNGTLNAAATDENDRILFTSDNKTPGAGDWGYIYFAQGSTGNLDFVTVEYGGDNNNTSSNTTGLSCAGIYINSSPTINHLTLSHISNVSQYNNGTYSNQTAAGIWIDADAAPVISNSLIEDIESHGIYASSDTTGAYHISNCDIQDSGSGLYIAGTGEYQVEKNTLSGNKLAGYWFPSSAANVTDNLFVDNDDNDALRIRGTIESNTTWNDDIKLYGTVTIAAGATLTINPGVKVYGYDRGSRLIVNGTLNAAATDENDRILFTSDNKTPGAGDWGYIYFAQGSTGNLDFVTVEYGGDNNNTSSNTTGLSCAGIYINSSPTINHLTLSHISNVSQYNNGTYSNQTAAGIWIDADAAPVISNSLIEDIESHGIYASSDTTGAYHISNCDIQDSGSGLYIAGTGEYQVEKNTLSGNKLAGYWFPSSAANVTDNLFVDNDDNDALRIRGTIKSNTTWNDDIKLYGTVTIAAGATLTINPGVKVYGYDRGSRLIVNGTLNAAATDENDRILFTSDNKTPGAGDWGYIYFAQGSTGNLDFVTVEYGGDNNNTSSNTTGLSCAGIYINSSPTINHLTLSHINNVSQYNNGTYSNQTAAGIWIRGDAAPMISNSLIENIESWGVYHQSTQEISLVGNTIQNNVGGGVYSSVTEVDARFVEWGDLSGPYHPVFNPDGNANRVSNNVLFTPWIDEDSDNDGLPDEWELQHGLDRFFAGDADADPDNDDLTNLQEFYAGTKPGIPDSDNDNMPDGWEAANGLDPLFNDALGDFDNDGYSNLREFITGSDPGNENEIPLIISDMDEDGDADGNDLVIFLNELGREDCTENSPCHCDFNCDGKINEDDLMFLSEDFGRF